MEEDHERPRTLLHNMHSYAIGIDYVVRNFRHLRIHPGCRLIVMPDEPCRYGQKRSSSHGTCERS
ncbi:hypothetical protein FHX05_006146 [Rhizobium sp. BK491]|nr:hypothetical protein [Rhizobium sp. BK491]